MILSPEIKSFLAERRGHKAHWLIWIEAKNRSTGATEVSGFWTGDDDQTFTIDGVARDYFGAGGLIEIDPIIYEAGLNVQMQSLSFGPVTPEVEQLLRTYDPRLAPIQVHLAVFDPADNTLVGTARAIKGWVDSAPITESGDVENPTATCEITVATSARAGTRSLTAKKSDAAQKLRSGDRGRRYGDVSGAVSVWWGEAHGSVDSESPSKRFPLGS